MWVCPQCGVRQDPDDIRTVEIVEPGRNSRVEFHGRIRPHKIGNAIEYGCMVCGHVWGAPPEDPTPGGASVTFLHPIFEDRDAC